MSDIVFDIETGPCPEEEIKELVPRFDAPSNYKDPDKIAAYVAEKEKDWYNKAALSATTGKVLAVGYIKDDIFTAIASGDEAADLRSFWDVVSFHGAIVARIIGFNSNAFDIPFLIRRSWKLGVRVPDTLMKGRYLHDNCIDLMDVWRCGNRDTRISLDNLSRFLKIGEKNGSGAEFAKLFSEDPKAAIAYLENDVRLTLKCAQKLGVLYEPSQ